MSSLPYAEKGQKIRTNGLSDQASNLTMSGTPLSRQQGTQSVFLNKGQPVAAMLTILDRYQDLPVFDYR